MNNRILMQQQPTNKTKPSIPSDRVVLLTTLPAGMPAAKKSLALSDTPHVFNYNETTVLYPLKEFLPSTKQYTSCRILGSGSFGIVCEAYCSESMKKVAIKKVLQDPRYKNRELGVMKELIHPNIVELIDFFYTDDCNGHESPQRYLNLVMEYIPETVYRVLKSFVRNDKCLPMILVQLYTYQLCRSIGYLHSLGICHRDIKPQNLLVDPETHVLKLCDFGSAKRLIPSEHSVSYICSRYYRAPELMLGATEYTTAIDLWSIGCVLGELLLGRPLFSGDTSVDQLVKIIQIIGSPLKEDMQAMNPNYQEFQFPRVVPKNLLMYLEAGAGQSESSIPVSAVHILMSLLKYDPRMRLKPYEALSHAFFNPLRDELCALPNGNPLPDLFNFTENELEFMSFECRNVVIPEWYQLKHSVSSQ